MPIQYENYQGKAYYLHCGQTKTGKPKYYFSMKSSGETLADAIPAGYEVYEKPNGQVFLRKSTPQLISEAEIEIVDQAMRNHKSVKYFKLDVKGKLITVYIAEDSISRIAAEFGLVGFMAPKEGVIRTMLRYSPEMRFELVDQDRRLFSVDRFCYRGSVDDWMQISVARPLAEQAAKFLPHLGKESFYELY